MHTNSAVRLPGEAPIACSTSIPTEILGDIAGRVDARAAVVLYNDQIHARVNADGMATFASYVRDSDLRQYLRIRSDRRLHPRRYVSAEDALFESSYAAVVLQNNEKSAEMHENIFMLGINRGAAGQLDYAKKLVSRLSHHRRAVPVFAGMLRAMARQNQPAMYRMLRENIRSTADAEALVTALRYSYEQGQQMDSSDTIGRAFAKLFKKAEGPTLCETMLDLLDTCDVQKDYAYVVIAEHANTPNEILRCINPIGELGIFTGGEQLSKIYERFKEPNVRRAVMRAYAALEKWGPKDDAKLEKMMLAGRSTDDMAAAWNVLSDGPVAFKNDRMRGKITVDLYRYASVELREKIAENLHKVMSPREYDSEQDFDMLLALAPMFPHTSSALAALLRTAQTLNKSVYHVNVSNEIFLTLYRSAPTDADRALVLNQLPMLPPINSASFFATVREYVPVGEHGVVAELTRRLPHVEFTPHELLGEAYALVSKDPAASALNALIQLTMPQRPPKQRLANEPFPGFSNRLFAKLESALSKIPAGERSRRLANGMMDQILALRDPADAESVNRAAAQYRSLCRLFPNADVQIYLRSRFAELRWPREEAIACISELFDASASLPERNALYVLLPLKSGPANEGEISQLVHGQAELFKKFILRLKSSPNAIEANALTAVQDRLIAAFGSRIRGGPNDIGKLRVPRPAPETSDDTTVIRQIVSYITGASLANNSRLKRS